MKKKSLIIITTGLLFLDILFFSSSQFMEAQAPSIEKSTNKIELSQKTKSTSQSDIHIKNKKAQKIYKKNKDILVLVNMDSALDDYYDADLKSICNGRLMASEKIYDDLVKMLAAANSEGYKYWIASAWRSREKQQSLVDEDVRNEMQKGLSYDEALQKTYEETMPAGHSEHETGLALDILCSGNTNMDASQESEPGNIWLRENCHRFGFILRYPEDKSDITKIHYEPWHFRYVGKEAATYMKKHDLTLEEFWELL